MYICLLRGLFHVISKRKIILSVETITRLSIGFILQLMKYFQNNKREFHILL